MARSAPTPYGVNGAGPPIRSMPSAFPGFARSATRATVGWTWLTVDDIPQRTGPSQATAGVGERVTAHDHASAPTKPPSGSSRSAP